MSDSFLSAGIDVGTTTSHLTISRLTVSNSAAPARVPRLVIAQRQIVYESPIRFTPLCDDGTINGARVAAMLGEEYERAGVSPAQIKSGAAIITGESAMLSNAATLIEYLSRLAGDFVVACAGAQLESILSARGSGACRASAERGTTICNIDVGGGTANLAVISAGRFVDSACLGIGGRFLKFDAEHNLEAITDSGETFLDAVAKSDLLAKGKRPDPELLCLLGNLLAEVIAHAAANPQPPQITQRLLVSEPLRHDYKIDEYWFSGGVAALMEKPGGDVFAFADMGEFLARGLKNSMSERGLKVSIPPNPIRATVLGAGSHSLQVSGSTITIDERLLPLRNLPVVRPFPTESHENSPQALPALRRELALRNLDWRGQPLALALPKLAEPDYDRLARRARQLCRLRRELDVRTPLVVIVCEDSAAALGQLLKGFIEEPVVVIDGIESDDGDYIDIGKPISGHEAVPVVMKTLVFRR